MQSNENKGNTGCGCLAVIAILVAVFFLGKSIIVHFQLQPKVNEVKTFVVVPSTGGKSKNEVEELFKQADIKPKFVAVGKQSYLESEPCDDYDTDQKSIIDPYNDQWIKAFKKANIEYRAKYFAKKGSTIVVPYQPYEASTTESSDSTETSQSSVTTTSSESLTETESGEWLSDKVRLPQKRVIHLDEDIDDTFEAIYTELDPAIDITKLNASINAKWQAARAEVAETGSSEFVDGGDFAQVVASIGYVSRTQPLQINLVDNWREIKDKLPNLWYPDFLYIDVHNWVDDGLNEQGSVKTIYPYPSIDIIYKGVKIYQSAYYYELKDYFEVRLWPTKEGEVYDNDKPNY